MPLTPEQARNLLNVQMNLDWTRDDYAPTNGQWTMRSSVVGHHFTLYANDDSTYELTVMTAIMPKTLAREVNFRYVIQSLWLYLLGLDNELQNALKLVNHGT